jgi:glycosyltransferase involved in cell wall biosynthesis
LDWAPNREGLLWLLREVWPAVINVAPELRLVIAGIGNGSYLAPFLDLPGVSLRGEIEQVSELYTQARAALIPVFSGSGVRVKALEAFAHGVPVLSTSKGIEGLGLSDPQHFLNCDDVEMWVDAITHWNDDAAYNRSVAAADFLRKKHEPLRLANVFIATLKQVVGDECRPSC